MARPPLNMKHQMSSHPMTSRQQSLVEGLRSDFIKLAEDMQDCTPESREQSLALTALEESLMWAVKAIACNPEVE